MISARLVPSLCIDHAAEWHHFSYAIIDRRRTVRRHVSASLVAMVMAVVSESGELHIGRIDRRLSFAA